MTPDSRLIDAIMHVMEAAFDPAFGEAWNRGQVADALALHTTHAIVINSDGAWLDKASASIVDSEAAGFVLSRAAANEEELLLIGVLPEFRRSGLGQKLIAKLIDESLLRGAEHLFLEMRRGNPAIELYTKLGFKPIGERRNYYKMSNGDRVDAITFVRHL